jgi:predicted nucleic acid-binding Zn ribbon protein
MRRLALLLGPALKDLGIHRQTREAQVAALWPALVGARLAPECRPERLQRGILTVRTTSAALSHQLRLERTILIDRLNAQLGDQVIREIRFMVVGS